MWLLETKATSLAMGGVLTNLRDGGKSKLELEGI